ncbi:MAG: family 43 glycosylhydrolase [Planctomycetota bacterium]
MNSNPFLKLVACLLVASTSLSLFAGNPIVPDVGMADPHCYVFEGKVYLFSTRDLDANQKKFTAPDWNIWSSEDLVHWKHERTITPSETYIGVGGKCWATETVFKNGKYYFYFSNGSTDTGVMIADHPAGPYQDALKRPMINASLTPGKEYDPTVLIDDDEQQTGYIIFGNHFPGDHKNKYRIARLSDDMLSLHESPKEIVINDLDLMFAHNDKPTLHKRRGIYYLSGGSTFAMSKDVYGPYQAIGNSGNGEHGLNFRGHGNYFTWNNQWFHTWCHFHLGRGVAKYRESYMSYLHYKDNGEMVTDTDFLEKHFATGVGQYNAGWDSIEAEWFMKSEGVAKRENRAGGFAIHCARSGGYLCFPNMAELEKQNQLIFEVSSANGARIEVRSKGPQGKLLGVCEVPATALSKSYIEVACELDDCQNVQDICLVFRGQGEDFLRLDRFKFAER